MKHCLTHKATKPLVFIGSLLPLAALCYGALTNGLGTNPAEHLVRATGDWTLRFLCLALAVTPLRELTRMQAIGRFRRMLGLFVYFYALLHLLSYSWFDMNFDVNSMLRDITKRPFILVGFVAVLLLTSLALTSNSRAMRVLGGRHWLSLHRLVYVIGGLGLLHFFWLRAGKHLFGEVAAYAAVIALLLGWRLWRYLRRHTPAPQGRMQLST